MEREIAEVLGDLAAQLRPGADPVGAREAVALIRGLPHGSDDLTDVAMKIAELRGAAADRALLARNDEVLREPRAVESDGLTGSLCTSLGQVRALGRAAQNCLERTSHYWEKFLSGGSDFWAVRRGGRLVAVVQNNRGTAQVIEAKGPRNRPLPLGDVQAVARFCVAAGLAIDRGCDDLLPQFAGPLVVGPRHVRIEDAVAVYAEWDRAVLIAVNSSGRLRPRCDRLALSFDADRPVAAAVIDGDTCAREVRQFGPKMLRRIVGAIALDQREPTLVQHRLLALAA